MAIALYNPIIVINNEKLFFKPNTLELTLGMSEIKVEAYTAGGGITETVHSEDLTTKFSILKGTVTNTESNMTLLESLKEFIGIITIRISEKTFSKVLAQCSFITNPAFQFQSEPATEIEFHGNPAL